MKKFLTALFCGAAIFTSSICFAAVDGSKIALGNIFPGMSAEDVTNAFGQPNRKDGDDWIYKNFTVEIERGAVKEISSRSDTITTPDGVRCGLAAESLNSTFGKADSVEHERDGVEYKYYSTDRTKKIEFKVTGGVITKITCELND